MLLEEQAAELLNRCEKILGIRLTQVRGNLKKAETRIPAVWEMLVLEAASEIGQVEYEPEIGGSPDIRLSLANSRPIWIEVAFLFPRFWKEERKSQEVVSWLHSEAKYRGIPSYKIYPRLDGVNKKNAGPVRNLPEINERNKFLNSFEIKNFFDEIIDNPSIEHKVISSNYTLSIFYSPHSNGPYNSSSGLVQEAPTVIEEHAVFRVLKGKAKQHDVIGPRIICIGSDQSPALTIIKGPMEVSLNDAIQEVFLKNKSISAVVTVSIEDTPTLFALNKQARCNLFCNPYAKTPLHHEEIMALQKLEFNKWKYTFKLPNWKNRGKENFKRATGKLIWTPKRMSIEIEIPANVVVDSLAGKNTLIREFDIQKDTKLHQALDEGWVVDACSFKNGNIELGEAPKIVLKLSPPFKVFDN
jgi:hypothetical protein